MYTLQIRKQMKATRLYDVEGNAQELQAITKASEPGKPFDFKNAQLVLAQNAKDERASFQASIDPTSDMNTKLDKVFGYSVPKVISSKGPTIENAKIQEQQNTIIAEFEESSRKAAEVSYSEQIAQDTIVQTKPYTVEAGDTFSKIALRNKLTLSALHNLNKDIVDINMIQLGQSINIPNTPPSEVVVAQAKPKQVPKKPSMELQRPTEIIETLESQLSTIDKQLGEYDKAMSTANTQQEKIAIASSKAHLIAKRMTIASTKRTQDFQKEEIVRANNNNENVRLQAKGRQVQREAIANSSPNQQLVADYEKYIDTLKKQRSANTNDWSKTNALETNIRLGGQGLQTAKVLLENDRQIGVHNQFIADNINDPVRKGGIPAREAAIKILESNNNTLLASLKLSPTYASVSAQNKVTA